MALRLRDVVISCIILFVAWGLAIQKVPVLRFLGYAFIAGILVSTIGAALLLLSVRSRQQSSLWEQSTFRYPSFVGPERWARNRQWLLEQETYKKESLYPRSFVVSDALDGLLGRLLRDFISSWYTSISRNQKFVNEIDRAVRIALCSIRDKLLDEDVVEIIVLQIVPLITKHLKEFFEAERAVRGPNLDRNVTDSEELDIAIARKYQGGNLHPAACMVYSDSKPIQQAHLRKLITRIIPEFLPENFLRSRSVTILITEIVSCAVIAPVMQALSDPDTWNQVLEAYVSFSVPFWSWLTLTSVGSGHITRP